MPRKNRKKIIYRIVIWTLLVASVIVLAILTPTLSKPEYLPSDDFVQTWAGGRLNLQGENPYDPQKIELMQISAGGLPSGDYTISIMLNPPWAVSLAMPFGVLAYPVSRLVWLIFSIILILLSSQMLWQLYSGDIQKRWLAILVAFIFAPTISVLEAGQITPIVLVGLVGFLFYTIYDRNDWIAGAFLCLASIKPQVAILFWVAFLFWIIQQKRWKIIFSAGLGTLILTIVAYLFNPSILKQYISMLQTYQVSDWASPTIGAYLRFFLFGVDKYWLQFLPTLIGILWLSIHWYQNRKTWNWLTEYSLILLVSQVTTFYSWTYDQIILLPAILQAVTWLLPVWKRRSSIFFIIAFVAISVLDLLLHMKLSDFWFIWIAPLLLAWFLLIQWQTSLRRNYPQTAISELD